LLHGEAALQNFLAVPLREHGDDRVFLDDRVQDVPERIDRDERLRLPEHRVEGADRLSSVLGDAERGIEAVPQRLVVLVVARRDQLAQALHGTMRDAVTAMAGKGRTEHGTPLLAQEAASDQPSVPVWSILPPSPPAAAR